MEAKVYDKRERVKPYQYILDALPYTKPFLFVDAISKVTEEGIEGSCTFGKDEFFYEGHFKDNPITPGVILTECMAQIGLVCFGISLLKKDSLENLQIALTTSDMEYLAPVFPKEQVQVVSEKVYFRFNKLKCKVKMYDSSQKLVCRGVITGMLVTNQK